MMPKDDTFSPLGIASDNTRLVTCTGIQLEADIGVLEGLERIGCAAYAWLHMVACPPKGWVSHLDVERDPANRWQDEWIAVAIYAPGAACARWSGLTLHVELYEVFLIGFEHHSLLVDRLGRKGW